MGFVMRGSAMRIKVLVRGLAVLGFILVPVDGSVSMTRAGEMVQAQAPPREPEASGGLSRKTGWAFEVRDDQAAEPVWVGAWSLENCGKLRTGFASSNRLPSRRISGCQPLTFSAERSGTLAWVVSSDDGFVASATEGKCDQTVGMIMKHQERRPACAPVWVTPP
jgi:hypothetical protein